MLALLVINLLNSMSFQGDILNVSHAQSFSCIIVMANCSKPFNRVITYIIVPTRPIEQSLLPFKSRHGLGSQVNVHMTVSGLRNDNAVFLH